MAQTVMEMQRKIAKCTELEYTIMTASVAIGAAGAVDATITGSRVPANLVVANTGAGTFSVAYPACPNCTIVPAIELSAAGTVQQAFLTAKAPTSGTATLTTRNAAGAATNPASGDLISIVIHFLPVGQTA